MRFFHAGIRGGRTNALLLGGAGGASGPGRMNGVSLGEEEGRGGLAEGMRGHHLPTVACLPGLWQDTGWTETQRGQGEHHGKGLNLLTQESRV